MEERLDGLCDEERLDSLCGGPAPLLLFLVA
jgi:hypothetical protein